MYFILRYVVMIIVCHILIKVNNQYNPLKLIIKSKFLYNIKIN